MRTLIINLLATALLLFGASSAGAWGLNMSLNPGSVAEGTVAVSDFVVVDVYLDAEPGLGFLGVAVVWDDDGMLVYEPGLSTMPTYILYTGGKGATYLIPNVSPPAIWGGANQPGNQQINIEYLENAFGSATATGNGIWLATLVFHVASLGDGGATVTLAR